MKKIFIAACIALAAGMGLSCNKVLDLQPLNSFSENNVWTSPSLVQVFVNQIYSEAVLQYKDAGFGWGAQTDELLSNFNWCNENQYVLGQATPDNQRSSFPLNYSSTINFWSTMYGTVKETNTFFQNIDHVDSTGNGALIKSLKGQVHFLRALCYFELLKRFGGVPIITKVYTNNDKTFNESRASWDSTAGFILSELSAAIPLLPPSVSGDQNGRATVGACLALKSRLLLYAASPYFNKTNDKSKWQAAADAAKAVINMNAY